MLDTWRRSGRRPGPRGLGPLAAWWTRTARRIRRADIGSVAGFCLVFLALLAAWLLGAVSSGAAPVMALLLALAVPCLAVATWLFLALRPQPQGKAATTGELERKQLLRAVNNMPIGLVMFD